MRKLYFFLVLLFLIFYENLQSQIRFTIELQPDNVTYLVKLRPEQSYTRLFSLTNSAQLTLVTPTGGFEVSSITNIHGMWGTSPSAIAPLGGNQDYVFFVLRSSIDDVTFTEGEEVELFSFQNSGECTGVLTLITEDDPFFPPNDSMVNAGNSILFLGNPGVNGFSGTYGSEANCLDDSGQMNGNENNDLITITSLSSTPPSDCGRTDGTIEVTATHRESADLQYRINDRGWSANPVFTGLESGVNYNVQVRSLFDSSSGTFIADTVINLPGPILADVRGVNTTMLTCDNPTGSITIDAVNVLNDRPLTYSIGEGEAFTNNTGVFENLPAGTYQPVLTADGAICVDELEPVTLVAPTDCMMEEDPEDKEFTFDGKDCPVALALDAEDGVFTVSLLSDVSLTFPQSITNGLITSFIFPNGEFEIIGPTSLVEGMSFGVNKVDENTSGIPDAAGDNVYVSFNLLSTGQTSITYDEGVKLPLFTFEVMGNCTGNEVVFYDNANDIFANTVWDFNNLITTFGFGAVEPCVTSCDITDCGTVGDGGGSEEPNAEDIVRDTFILNIPMEENTTVCLDSVIDLDTIVSSFVCENGQEVTVTTGNSSDCIEITSTNSFNNAETICVVHCDDEGNCDTTVINLCPSVTLGGNFSICEGEAVQLSPMPSNDNGTYRWTTDGSISCTDCEQPEITPTNTTDYILSYTNGECASSDTLTVSTVTTPEFSTVNSESPTGCEDNGSITIEIIGDDTNIEYSINNGTTFQSENIFSDLPQGTYEIQIRDRLTNCTINWSEAVILTGDTPITIDSIVAINPNNCRDALGSIQFSITTSNLTTIPEFRLNDGEWVRSATFNDLEAGTYEAFIREQGVEGCEIAYQNNPIELTSPEPVQLLLDADTFTFCESDPKLVTMELSEPIDGFSIDPPTFANAEFAGTTFRFESIGEESIVNYSITLTGVSGCDASGEIAVVSEDCDTSFSACNFFTGLDTLRTNVNEDGIATVCLPTSGVDISNFVILKDGVPYEATIATCEETSITYNLDFLGSSPYRVIEWAVGTDTLRDFEFNTFEELVNEMNEFDTHSNWVLNDMNLLVGIISDVTYGTLNIFDNNFDTSILAGNTNSLQSITLDEVGVQTLVIRDTEADCQDSLIINVGEAMDDDATPPFTETLELTTTVNTPILDECVDRFGMVVDSIMLVVCDDPENGSVTLQDDYCFDYSPNTDFIGVDSFCVALCSPSNRCDTVRVIVNILSNDLVIFNGFSPNNDGINDYFTVENIESYPNNQLQIFNRWGNRVYLKDNYNNDWDGTFDNLQLPNGVYFYLLNITINEERQMYSGYIELMR